MMPELADTDSANDHPVSKATLAMTTRSASGFQVG